MDQLSDKPRRPLLDRLRCPLNMLEQNQSEAELAALLAASSASASPCGDKPQQSPRGDTVRSSTTTPDGWKLVPTNPTKEMLETLWSVHQAGKDFQKSAAECYRAMLRLAPSAPSATKPSDREAALQAKIDALMLEHCPDEMTPEQLANWAAHQRPAGPEAEAALDAAVRAGTAAQDSGSNPECLTQFQRAGEKNDR